MSRQPELFEQSAPPRRRSAAAGEVRPAWDSPLLQAPVLPTDIKLGTSSWFFPGWRGLVYDGVHPQVALSRKGLAAYAEIPLLRTVSLDRTFYASLTAVEYQRYAHQVPDSFSFVVKAPALVCDAVMRDEEGRGKVTNPHFLDAAIAARVPVVAADRFPAGQAMDVIAVDNHAAAADVTCVSGFNTNDRVGPSICPVPEYGVAFRIAVARSSTDKSLAASAEGFALIRTAAFDP